MKIAHRLALGFALLVSMLIAVITYHGGAVRALEEMQGGLINASLPVTLAVVWMEQSVEEQESIVRKIIGLRDLRSSDFISSYVGKLSELRSEFADRLGELDSLADLSDSESAALKVINQVWRGAPEVPAERADGPATVDTPGRPNLGDPSPASEALGLGRVPRVDTNTEHALAHLTRLRDAVHTLRRAVVEETPRVLQTKADAAGAQLARTNRLVLIAALVSSLIVWFLTSRSISRSLGALTEGTRAVADGRFGVQLEVQGNDEVSRVAAAFNTMTRRLEALDRMKKDFVARVSHDLRTPLVAMQETNDLLLAGLAGPLAEQQERLVRLNRESGRRLGGRIANLLALSRIEAGAFELDMKVQDLCELARFVLREILVPIRRRGLNLDVDIPEPPIVVRLDDERITQVLENLLDNAIKHTPKGGTISFSIRATDELAPENAVGRRPWPADGYALITITDSGPGVEIADRTRIFHSFYRSRARPATHGTGLGLAICRDLVEGHDGTVWVDDGPNGGAQFHVVLPRSPGKADAKVESSEVTPPFGEDSVDHATFGISR